jgi:error-prone DNA polymerase
MKCDFPDVFAAALLNSQPMGFYAPSQIVRDAQDHGIEVRPADINLSDWDCTLEEGTPATGRIHRRHASMEGDVRSNHAIRLGLRQIAGISEKVGARIMEVRGAGCDSVRDFWLRTGLEREVIEKLAAADAFRSIGLDRRNALWAIRALRRSGDKDDLPLFAHARSIELEPDASLPVMPLGQHVVEDYKSLRLSLKAHPVSFLRSELAARNILRCEQLAELPPDRWVTVAGIVLVRQRPGSANGVIFATLEDETGIANTICWPKVFEAYRPIVMGARFVAVTGKLQSQSGVIHVVADHLEDLTPMLMRLATAGPPIDTLSCGDEIQHPGPGSRSPEYIERQRARQRLLGLTPREAEEAMPRGRNFH